jgi:hypothetical protein
MDLYLERLLEMTHALIRPSITALMLAAVGSFALTCSAAAAESYAPAPVVPLVSESAPRLFVDTPLAAQLANGLVVIRYRTENLRIVPVFGPAALDVSPRLGHIHVTVDDAPWHWADASGEPLIVQGLTAGPHKILIELADPTHRVIDRKTVDFVVPERAAAHD